MRRGNRCVFFSSNYNEHRSLWITPPISFHGPTDPGLLSILAPQSPQRWAGQMYWGKMLALRHTTWILLQVNYASRRQPSLWQLLLVPCGHTGSLTTRRWDQCQCLVYFLVSPGTISLGGEWNPTVAVDGVPFGHLGIGLYETHQINFRGTTILGL